MKRVFILVLDSFGMGYTYDAEQFNDVGSNTFGHIIEDCYYNLADKNRFGPLKIPNLTALGIGEVYYEVTGNFPLGLKDIHDVIGCYGYSSEISTAKDTSSGHWEIAGAPVLFKWDYFKKKTKSFPKRLLNNIIKEFQLTGILGNCHASGTEILNNFGEMHIKTNQPIFYTSSDSVFQVCCHEKYFGLDNLYNLCIGIRKILNKLHFNIARVIARPFIGDQKNHFIRTGNRKDFSKPVHQKTVIQKLVEEKCGSVVAIGKISDIFNNSGITKTVHSVGLKNLIKDTIFEIQNALDNTIVFVNFVDFDSIWGHRRDVSGYASGLELFDSFLPKVLHSLYEKDILIITADHGCDPTWFGTDHTREYVPILLYSRYIGNSFIGHRETFSDISQTISKYFSLSKMNYGKYIV